MFTTSIILGPSYSAAPAAAAAGGGGGGAGGAASSSCCRTVLDGAISCPYWCLATALPSLYVLPPRPYVSTPTLSRFLGTASISSSESDET
jgi:hypothetical protein